MYQIILAVLVVITPRHESLVLKNECPCNSVLVRAHVDDEGQLHYTNHFRVDDEFLVVFISLDTPALFKKRLQVQEENEYQMCGARFYFVRMKIFITKECSSSTCKNGVGHFK